MYSRMTCRISELVGISSAEQDVAWRVARQYYQSTSTKLCNFRAVTGLKIIIIIYITTEGWGTWHTSIQGLPSILLKYSAEGQKQENNWSTFFQKKKKVFLINTEIWLLTWSEHLHKIQVSILVKLDDYRKHVTRFSHVYFWRILSPKRPTIIKEELDVELPRLHLQNFGLGDLFI